MLVQRLLSTKSDVMKALQTLRMRFQMDVSTLVDKIAWAQGNLTKTHTELQSSQANDKLTIRRDVKTGVGSLEQQTLTELNTDGDAEKSNIQSIISAKELLVNQLARSTDVLILALRNRVRLATGKEDTDNTAQENQLKSNDGTVQKWIRERYSLYLLYWCKRRGTHFTCFTDTKARKSGSARGTHFACCTGANAHTLTQLVLQRRDGGCARVEAGAHRGAGQAPAGARGRGADDPCRSARVQAAAAGGMAQLYLHLGEFGACD